MKKADVKIGQILAATSEEELKHPFQGKVEKIYENSALSLSIIGAKILADKTKKSK